jgi:hypothetical protein
MPALHMVLGCAICLTICRLGDRGQNLVSVLLFLQGLL